MRSFSRTPAYNLKAVLKETGLTADVLRVWERRYGLPKPQRTAGGHRLYSEYDIETVKWLRARQAEGLSISRAVKTWKEILEAGLDPLEFEQPAPVVPAPSLPLIAETRIDLLRQSWLEAALAFNASRAEEVLNQAFAMYPTEAVCIQILQQGLSMIGADWYTNKITVQQEHFASSLAVRRLETLITLSPRPTREQIVLTGCPPGERHTFPVMLLNLLLRRSGLNVIYLGDDIPVEHFAETAASIHPNLIVLAAQQLVTAASLRSTADWLAKSNLPVAYGGLIFNRIPELRSRIPAHFLGESLEGALHMVEKLVLQPAPAQRAAVIDAADQRLARLFREKRPQIEARVYEMFAQNGVEIEYQVEANTFFGDGLAASLDLGDPAFLEADLEWLKYILTGRLIPADRIKPYLSTYRLVIQNELGDAGIRITDWITAFLQKDHQLSPAD